MDNVKFPNPYGLKVFRAESADCDHCNKEPMPRLDNSVVLCQPHIDELLKRMDEHNKKHAEEEYRRNSIVRYFQSRRDDNPRGALIVPKDELLEYANLCINWPDELPKNFTV